MSQGRKQEIKDRGFGYRCKAAHYLHFNQGRKLNFSRCKGDQGSAYNHIITVVIVLT